MAEDFSKHVLHLNEETIEPTEVADIVRQACEARKGWEVLLSQCSLPRRGRHPSVPSAISIFHTDRRQATSTRERTE